MKILYFAWVREKVGKSEESLSPPPDLKTVKEFLVWLSDQGPEYRDAFSDFSKLRVAINQNFTGLDAPFEKAEEVAIFPPVTGG